MKHFPKICALLISLAVAASASGSICLAAELPAGAEGLGIFKNRTETHPDSGDDTLDQGTGETGTTPQLTAKDLEKMNGGDITMLFSDEGYLTFLRGRYYDGQVTNYEEAIESLFGMESLLGLSRGSEFFCVYVEKDAQDYTYYTYLQRYGDITLENAVMKIIVDPDGYTAGLISSFLPNIGIAPENEASISAEEAIQVVREEYPEDAFVYFQEDIRQTSITYENVALHCWAVFTDIPAEWGMLGDRQYMEHLVTYQGVYLGYMLVNTTKELQPGDNVAYAAAMSWFLDKSAQTCTREVTRHDGTTVELTFPVVRDELTGIYYLADPNRHILVADYDSFEYHGELVPMSSEDNLDWPEHYLLTYNTYIQVYDFFYSHGMDSVDGFGMPILILADCCNYDGTPIDNAFFAGFDLGWAKFGASAVNDYGECVDVIGHEFTHGITTYTFAGDLYENESGAVNEALSDIMGNLIEMILGATEDETWLIAENTGNPIRSMSFPWLFKQPVEIGGEFYYPTEGTNAYSFDSGGVHINSSLVNYVAWELCAQGMTLEEAYNLWRETINLLTPLSEFREVHAALMFAAEILQMDVEWLGRIDMLCKQAGY